MRAKLIILINKFILIILCYLFSGSVKAQDTIIINNNYKYKIGLKFISERSSVISINTDNTDVISGGIQVIKRIKKSHFNYETGLYYYNKASEFEFFPYSPSFTSPNINFYYHNLSIPLNIRYETKVFYFSAGIYLDYLISDSKYTEYSFNLPVRRYNFGANLDIGIEKPISKLINVYIEARVLQNLTSVFKDSRSNYNFINHGLGIGINYNF